MNNQFKEKYGAWAIITGASSGIGVEFTKQIAALGLNVALVARRKARLDALAQEIAMQYKVQTKVIECDVAQDGFQEIILEATKNLEVGLLVNNAGINCEGQFFRGNLDRNVQMIQVNMKAPFILAYEFGKIFVSQKKGGIIFTSSISAFNAHPYLSHYAATKAYILSLAESMNYEFKDKNVDVIALCPGMTKSEMTRGMKDSIMLMEAKPVVEAALQNLGKEVFVVPGIVNKVQTFINGRMLGRISARNLTAKLLENVLPGVKEKKSKK
jgi:short-subunit dehydrogenase